MFPYVVGTAYYGEVYPTDGNTGPNSGFVVISEPVTAYIQPSTAVAELKTLLGSICTPTPRPTR